MRKFHNSTMALALTAMLSQPASAGFFGPSTQILKGEALTQMLQSQPVVVSISGVQLDVRSKSAVVGGVLLGFFLSSAMASGGMQPGMNAQQMQQNMQANMQITQMMNQTAQSVVHDIAAAQAAKPTAQLSKEGPLTHVHQQVLASVMQTPSIKATLDDPKAKPSPTDLQLQISQPQWTLDFSMASSDYSLVHKLEVALYQKQSDTIYFKEACAGNYARKMPKEDWEKDDFAAVALASKEIADKCALQVIAALGLVPGKVIELTAEPDAAARPAAEVVVPDQPTPPQPPATPVSN